MAEEMQQKCLQCKRKGIVKCDGCTSRFCSIHSSEHRHELDALFEQVCNDRDILCHQINSSPQPSISNHPQLASLYKEIDEWEQRNLKMVGETANHARKRVTEMMMSNNTIAGVELDKISNEPRQRKDDDGYFEQDIGRLSAKLEQIRIDFNSHLPCIRLNFTFIDWSKIIEAVDETIKQNIPEQQEQLFSGETLLNREHQLQSNQFYDIQDQENKPVASSSSNNVAKNDTQTKGYGDHATSSSSSSVVEKPQPKSSTKDNKTGSTAFGSSSASAFGSLTPINSNDNGLVFGGAPSFKLPINNTSSDHCSPSIGVTTAATKLFQFSTRIASVAPTTTALNTFSTFSSGLSSPNKPLFGNTPKVSFAELAKKSSTTGETWTSNGTEQRVFAGQDSLISGTNAATTPSPNTTITDNNKVGASDGAGGKDDSYALDVSFKPIVKLFAVEVLTGEEDENVLFCERAKLYRFDSADNQMKERGIGEMKILQHKTTTFCRIVMRREQVLKLCANHLICQHMKLLAHQGSENAYVWSAMDYADGSAKHETLCVKFRTSDMAQRFVKQFHEAKEINAKTQQ